MTMDLVFPFQHAGRRCELECSVSPYSYSLGIGEKNGLPERVLVEVVLIFAERLEYLQNPDSRKGKDGYLGTFWTA